MAISITPDSKTDVTISNTNKSAIGTFDQGTRTFADGGTFGEPGQYIIKDSKNSVDITNENKN